MAIWIKSPNKNSIIIRPRWVIVGQDSGPQRYNFCTMNTIPAEFRDLLANETRAFAYLATTLSDGSPQLTAIWFTADDEHILFNSVKGRIKDKNIRARPQIALLIADPAKPYRYLQLRGRVVEMFEDENLIHELSQVYTGTPKFNIKAGDVRVTYKFLPESVQTYNW